MDTFVEQIVPKKKGAKEYAVIGLTVFAALILTAALLIFLTPFFILVIGIGYGAWWLISNQSVEFEYSVTNGDIDIDQIVARRKRNRIVSVSGGKIETMEPYNQAAYANRRFDRRVVAAPSEPTATWCFTYRSKKNGHTLVVFEPDERVLKALTEGLPKLVQMDIKKRATQ